eukprot:1526310-Prymnesium_polylepis.1
MRARHRNRHCHRHRHLHRRRRPPFAAAHRTPSAAHTRLSRTERRHHSPTSVAARHCPHSAATPCALAWWRVMPRVMTPHAMTPRVMTPHVMMPHEMTPHGMTPH